MSVQKPETGNTLLLDIGTAYISAGVLSHHKEGNPRLEAIERVSIGGGTETSKEALLSLVEEGLKTILEKYKTVKVRHTHVVLAAPWYEARIKTISSHAEKPVPISERTIMKAVTQYKNEAPPKPGNTDLEAVAVAVSVNGYFTEVRQPVVGQDLRINFYESETSESIVQKIKSRIESVIPHALVSYHSFPLISLVALRALTAETSFTVVDVAGEMTEVAVIHEDCIFHLASFPIGYYTIARNSTDTKEQVADALSRLEVYGRKELSAAESTAVDARFKEAFKPWVDAFQATLHDAAEQTPVPQQIFLITDREHTAWIRRGMEEEKIQGTIETVGAPYVQNFIELGDSATYDIFLSLSALFFHTYRAALIGETP